MINQGVCLTVNGNLESWLCQQPNDRFPKLSITRGNIPYPERYLRVKEALEKVHAEVERGAMAVSTCKWIDSKMEELRKVDPQNVKDFVNEIQISEPIIYLNNHGPEHVEHVIRKVSEMLQLFESGHLTPYEGYLLLCAIQIHDVGNIMGRKDHERRCHEILEEYCKNIIIDSTERDAIVRIAMTHSGVFGSSKDTIRALLPENYMFEAKVRERLLAALLRFGDELADDSSRVNDVIFKLKEEIRYSEIFLRYSAALNTVKLLKNPENSKLEIRLGFMLGSKIICINFDKYDSKKLLLDEIYDRTIKMEMERRYCMRYMRPYFYIDNIRVNIDIQNDKDLLERKYIRYTLEENGYPKEPKQGGIKDIDSSILSGEEFVESVRGEWSL